MFYGFPEHGIFLTLKVCVRRHSQWNIPSSREYSGGHCVSGDEYNLWSFSFCSFFFFFPTFSCFLSLGIYAYILRILLPNVLDLCVPFTFGDLFLYYRKLQNFMTLYLFITSHNCGTTGRIYENGLYSQNMLNVSTVMTGTEMRMICRFASQFA